MNLHIPVTQLQQLSTYSQSHFINTATHFPSSWLFGNESHVSYHFGGVSISVFLKDKDS